MRPSWRAWPRNGAGVIMPAGSGDIQGDTPTGAGPFRFVRREFGNEVELVRFDDYWDGPAYLDGILAREITEPTVRLTGLRTGELHFINDIPAERISEVEADPDLQVRTWAPLNFDFVNFNHKPRALPGPPRPSGLRPDDRQGNADAGACSGGREIRRRRRASRTTPRATATL